MLGFSAPGPRTRSPENVEFGGDGGGGCVPRGMPLAIKGAEWERAGRRTVPSLSGPVRAGALLDSGARWPVRQREGVAGQQDARPRTGLARQGARMQARHQPARSLEAFARPSNPAGRQNSARGRWVRTKLGRSAGEQGH